MYNDAGSGSWLVIVMADFIVFFVDSFNFLIAFVHVAFNGIIFAIFTACAASSGRMFPNYSPSKVERRSYSRLLQC